MEGGEGALWPIYIHQEEADEIVDTFAYLPANLWVNLVRKHPKLKAKSVIEIKTKNTTYLAHPLPASSINKDTIQLSYKRLLTLMHLKEDAQEDTIKDGYCRISNIYTDIPFATNVSIQADQTVHNDKETVRRLLMGCIISKDFSINCLVNDPCSNIFISKVEPASNTTPAIPTIFGPLTSIQFVVNEQNAGAFAQVEDIIIACSTDLLPLSKKQRFLPRGILLYGPPGVGKTHLVKSICVKHRIPLKVINGPEIIAPELGQSEINLKAVFDDSIHSEQLSILFIDEIDSIAVKREEGIEQHQVRLLGHLLKCIDSYTLTGNLIIIGATNRPNSIDPALRRPGRFDREIYCEPPDELVRYKIIESLLGEDHARSMQVNIKEIAKRTIGYVAADLVALTRNMILTSIANNDGFISKDIFEKCFSIIKPSLHREYRVNYELGLTWDDLGGMKEVKEKLCRAIQWPLLHSNAFMRLGIKAPRGVLLYGPPGCSKTTIAKILAASGGFNFYSINGAAIYSAYVGESERLIRQLFSNARMTPPSLLFIDEIDALVGNRTATGVDIVQERILSTLLNEMDGIEEAGQIIVLGATNRKDAIDAALLRPGRFDILINVPLPDQNDRLAILKAISKKMPLSNDVCFESIVEVTDGFSGADLKNILQEAALFAIRNDQDEIFMNDIVKFI